MARPQSADYAQRREAIVEKAAELFAAKGFNGASMAELAAACETSKSLFYHYHPSKEDVLHAVMASHIDQLASDVEDVERLGAGPADRLAALIRTFMDHYVGAASRQKVLLNELVHLPADRRKAIVEKQRMVIDAVQRLLCAVHPALGANQDRAKVETMLLFGMINWTHTWFDPEGPVSADEVADMVVERALAPMKTA
ncbi:TetR/AcrR family transcriptional regulator [Sphingosinicella rhizophila]|uniref:TetR/AcrR family transcriptional regulator n=1 Tax=Sphingosinicella rhizophila TaxID=3050082 RepID=A0ABU3QA27_9SPHN|nr:TetR/AcrR family transcriptional regulator [Sphingosinicella sp. GR2756]MDT9599974.1 TetR/AcrR family transcriptional regulator [Sphingosinicella sp. GR2756]